MSPDNAPSYFKSGFQLDVSPSYPASVEADISRHVGPGLYRVVVHTETGPQQIREPFDEIEFSEVKEHDDSPNIEADYLVQLLVARMDKHNEIAGIGPIKYAVKFLTKRPRGRPPAATWSTIVRDVSALKQQENDGLPPLDLHIDHDRMAQAQYAGAFSELRYVVQDMRADRAEHRADMGQANEVIRDLLGQVRELATAHLAHQDEQAKVNAAGWEALHEGIAMQKEVAGKLDAMSKELETTKLQLAIAQKELAAAGRDAIVDMVGPAIAGQAAKKMEQAGKGGFISNALKMLATMGAMPGMPGVPGMPGMPMPLPAARQPQPAAQPQVVIHQQQPQPKAASPTNGSAASVMPQVDIVEICTPAELIEKPMCCLGRLLGATLMPTQLAVIEQALTADEWQNFKLILGAANDAIVFGCAFSLYGSMAKDQGRMNKMAEVLTEFQQNLLSAISDRISGTVKGPLDPTGLSTKPVDQAKLLTQAMEQNRRMAEQMAEQARMIEELRKEKETEAAEAEEPAEEPEPVETEESDEPPPETPQPARRKRGRAGAEI